MRKLSSLIGSFALTAGLLTACTIETPDDPFASASTNAADADDGDTAGDDNTTTDDEAGTGDTTTGDDTTTSTTDEGCAPGTFGCPCDNGACNEGLECGEDDTCGLSSTTEEDTTTTTGPDLGMCDPTDQYCLSNGCMEVMGNALVLDTDMDMVNDWGWCLHPCTTDDECPPHPGGGMPACTAWNMEGDMACFVNCDGNDPMSCGEGAECSTIAGPPICLYDAANF